MNDDNFLVGMIIGLIISVLTFLLTMSIVPPHKCQLTVDKKIQPEWELKTDGKVVDTLYTYKKD